MKSVYIILTLCVTFNIQVCFTKNDTEDTPKVDIPNYLTILGKECETAWTKKKFLTFHDMRYAQPLTDENAFSPPLPHVPEKDEVYDAQTETVHCPSIADIDDFQYDEITIDCLFLTVSTKNITGKSPVMVHLAGFDIVKKENSNDDAKPEYLLEEDVVLVSVQYRVGVFGFLSTMTKDIPGNVGIMDVILSLAWVQKFISHFGGDPKSVTIFGQYHSAAIAHILTMSPNMGKLNVFHKVIYQSGSALMPNLINQNPKDMANYIGKYLKIDCQNDETLNHGLQTADKMEILRAYKSYVNNFAEDEDVPLIIVGDPHDVLPEMPQELLKRNAHRVYPTIGGAVEQPSTCAINALKFLRDNKIRSLPSYALKGTLDSVEELFDAKDKNNSTLRDEMTQAADLFRDILSFSTTNGEQMTYIQELFPKKIFTKYFLKTLAPLLMDVHSIPIKAATMEALRYNTVKGGKSYLYAFNYNPSESRLECQANVYVVQLTDDDIFLFPQDNISLSKKENILARLMVELWTSFAATGKPKAHSLYNWPPIMSGYNGPYFAIDTIHKVSFDYSEEYFAGLRAQRNDIDLIDV